MPNSLTISYNSSTIYSGSAPVSFTIDTEGTYCEHDIAVNVDFLDTTATASAADILSGKTAFVNGAEVIGTIATKTNTNLIANGSTVTVPAGYYAAQYTKNIATGAATTPAQTITTNPTMSFNSATGVVTATYAGSSSITPTVTAGYIAAGTAGTVSTAGTSTYTITLYSGAITTIE